MGWPSASSSEGRVEARPLSDPIAKSCENYQAGNAAMRSLRLGAGYVQGVSRIRYNDSDESNTYSSILTTVLLISTRERTVTRPSHPAARCSARRAVCIFYQCRLWSLIDSPSKLSRSQSVPMLPICLDGHLLAEVAHEENGAREQPGGAEQVL